MSTVGGNSWSTAGTLTPGVTPPTPITDMIGGGSRPYYPAWWELTLAEDASVSIDSFATTGDYPDTILTVYSGSEGAPVTEANNDDYSGAPFNTSKVMFTATAGVTYHVRVGSYDNSTDYIDDYVLTVTAATLVPGVNDDLADAVPLPIATPISVTASAATIETDEEAVFGTGWEKSLWWRYDAPMTGQLWMTDLRGDGNTEFLRVDVATGGPAMADLTPVYGETNTNIQIEVEQGQTYWIRIAQITGDGYDAYGFEARQYERDASAWIQADDYDVNPHVGYAVDIIVNQFSGGHYTDPGTPFSPAIDPAFLDAVIADAQAETSWDDVNVAPFWARANQTGGAFPGDTLYDAYRDHTVMYAQAVGLRGFNPPLPPPEWADADGYQFEPGHEDGQAEVVEAWLQQVFYRDYPEVNVSDVTFTFDLYASNFDEADLPPVHNSSPRPVLDLETDWAGFTGPIASIDGGLYPASGEYELLPIVVDLTPYLTGDDGWLALGGTTNLVSGPTYDTFGDEIEYAWGGTILSNDANARYVLRPPQYRWYRLVEFTGEPEPAFAPPAPCRLWPRADGRGPGAGRLWPRVAPGRQI